MFNDERKILLEHTEKEGEKSYSGQKVLYLLEP